ncbi:aluminum activated malate transporter-domain-containing protein [Gilbertella persicaria]|uniref:aluminum activated malate transporter-domain-containing protein n=1 Tax=Gilbertella persicaria TaxID=101096 RepID=UPI00221FC0E7|nr:aluminum activated malate transporter-domain-containing protein [Gilbertella persicaria]KAI8068112.1 aluminum activated malate transporter-domain-containing protein [Gilbertella persicaria]
MIPACIWCAISASLYSNGAGVIASLGFLISVFLTAYFRLKYPRLLIPSLQAFTIPFFGLTRNIYATSFDVMSIVGIFYPTLIGGGIALMVNLILWPETAARISEASFGSALSSISSVLDCIDTEVLKDHVDVAFSDLAASKKLRQTIQKLDTDIAKMQKSRREAKYEIVISHYCPLWYKSFAKTMDGMTQNLYGLSLAVEREAYIILDQKLQTHQKVNPATRLQRQYALENGDTLMSQGSEYIAIGTNKLENGGTVSRIEYKFISRLNSSVQPEIKQFVQTCAHAMKSIRYRLETHRAIHSYLSCVDHANGQYDLTSALVNLDNAKVILQKEYEERQSEPTEDHYLIFTILFCLTQFGQKLVALDKQATELIQKRKSGRFPRVFFPHVHWRKWLEQTGEHVQTENTVTEHVLFGQQHVLNREDTRRSEHHPDSSEGTSAFKPSGGIDKRMSIESDWEDKASVALQHAPGNHVWNKWLYTLNVWCRTDPFRYAVKFTVTMELLALMAWLPIPGVNELYNNNHGQWALLSAMVVFNFTVGSTLTQCVYRVVATVIGAICGYLSLLAAGRNANPYVLAVMILIFQVPMWFTLLGSKYPRIGFISLLTLAVISSTGYIDTNQEDLFAPVWKRTLTAIIAILVVIVIDHLLWPVWARTMVRKHLSDLLIATGIQYSKVASLVCQENTQSYRYKSTLLDAQINAKVLKRQQQMTSQMLELAVMEPRITKGTFPIDIYRQMLYHERNILYWIDHLLKTQQFISEHVRKKIMNPLNPYRKELAAAVHLYLFTLAGSLRTKSSLPASLPSAEMARQILQKRQSEVWHQSFHELSRVVDPEDNTANDEETRRQKRSAENQIYWQTYAAGSVEVIMEQEAIGELMVKLMGQHIFKAATKDWIE